MKAKYMYVILLLLMMSTLTLFLGWVPIGDVIPKVILCLFIAVTYPQAYKSKSVLIYFLYLVYIFVCQLLSNCLWELSSWVTNITYLLIPLLVSNVAFSSKNNKNIHILAKYGLIVSAFTMFMSLIVLFEDPQAVRLLSAANSTGDDSLLYVYWRKGVADYSMTAMMMFMPATIMYGLRNGPIRVIWIIYFVLSLLFVYMANVTTPLFFCVAILFITQFPQLISKKYAIIAIAIVVGILYTVLPVIIQSVGLGDSDMSDKVASVEDISSDNLDETSDLAIRIVLLNQTIQAITSSPLFGNVSGEVGEHNYFLDLTARYGLIGLVLLLSIVYNQYKTIIKRMDLSQWAYFRLYLAFFILFGIVKNMSGIEFWNYLLVYYPCILLYLNKKQLVSNSKLL